MKETTQSYKNAARSVTSPRDIRGKIEIHITEDAGEYTYTSDSFIEGSKNSYFKQLFDGITEVPMWLSPEKGRLKLDGSMAVPAYYGDNYKYGVISKSLSDSNGSINFNIVVKFTSEHTSNGITLIFAEPVQEVTVMLDNRIHTMSDINSTECYVEDEDAFSTLTIKITKIEPYRRVRLNNIFIGQILQYDDDKIYSMNFIDEIDLKNESLPSCELDIEISDSDKEFNLLNPTGKYKYLKQKQLVIPYIGIKTGEEVEYVQMGKYYLKESTSGNKIATFTAYNIIEWWDSEPYRESVIGTSTLYDMLDNFLSGYEHEIDSELSKITVNSYIPVCTRREAFRLMLQAGNCIYRIEPSGKIIVNKHKELVNRHRYINYAGESVAGTFYTEIESKTLNGSITADNILEEYPTITQTTPYASCVVNIYSYTVSSKSETLYSGKARIENATYENGKYKVWIPYDSAPATQISINVSEYKAYADGCYVYITADTDVVITGKKVEVGSTEYLVRKYNYDNECSVDNVLVRSETVANDVAAYMLNDYGITAELDYRGFPYLDTGDEILVETDFCEQNFYLTKHTLNYDGTLSGSMEGVGKANE